MASLFRGLRNEVGLNVSLTDPTNREAKEWDNEIMPPGTTEAVWAMQEKLAQLSDEQKEEMWRSFVAATPPGEAEELAIGVALDEGITFDEARFVVLAIMLTATTRGVPGGGAPSVPAPSDGQSRLSPLTLSHKSRKSKNKK